MFQGAPPCFDHGVRELQLRESQQAGAKCPCGSRRRPGHSRARRPRPPPRPASALRASRPDWRRPGRPHCSPAQTIRDPPRQDPSREIVDHRVQVGASPVEEANDGRVDVPHLVGSGRPKAHLRFRRVHPEPRTTPAELSHEVIPRRGRGPDLVEPLRQDGECSGRNVTVLGRQCATTAQRGDRRRKQAATSTQPCCTEDEGRPLGAGRQGRLQTALSCSGQESGW